MISRLFSKKIKEFIPIKLDKDNIKERVFYNETEVSGKLILVSLSPVIFGVFIERTLSKNQVSLSFHYENQNIVSVEAQKEGEIVLGKHVLDLVRPVNYQRGKLSFVQRHLELPNILKQSRNGKFDLSIDDIKHISAIYHYPHKVYLVVVKGKNYLNVFPMDLHMNLQEEDKYIFALQHTNLAEEILKETKQVLVVEIPSDRLKLAYELGKNHGKTNLFGQSFPFNTHDSTFFSYPVPEFHVGYREVLLSQHVTVGSHTIFTGSVVNEENTSTDSCRAYHIHRFHYHYCLRKNLISPSNKL